MLSGLDLVRVLQFISIRDLLVLIGIAVELLADLRAIIARLHRIGPICLAKFDTVLEIGKMGINLLDCIPNLILAGLRRCRCFN